MKAVIAHLLAAAFQSLSVQADEPPCVGTQETFVADLETAVRISKMFLERP